MQGQIFLKHERSLSSLKYLSGYRIKPKDWLNCVRIKLNKKAKK